MKIDILTLFPEMFESLKTSLLGRATEKNIIEINLINFRDFTKDKHRHVDDTCFGGGAGMLLCAQPICDCIRSIPSYEGARKIYLSPRGKTFNQNTAKELAESKHLILLCGHYEGVDQRVLDIFNFEELSLGDFVLSGGEIPAMAVVDCVARLIPGVLGNSESAVDESFLNGMLEYPQYTRPAVFEGRKVPDVLLGGNHKKIQIWKSEESKKITQKNRPDLFKK